MEIVCISSEHEEKRWSSDLALLVLDDGSCLICLLFIFKDLLWKMQRQQNAYNLLSKTEHLDWEELVEKGT